MTTPSRARPSDRAIAAAFWEAETQGGRHVVRRQWIIDRAFQMEELDELDTEPRAGDGDAGLTERLRFTATDADFHGYHGNASLMREAAQRIERLAAQRNEGAQLSNLDELDSKSIGGQRNEGDGNG